MMVVGRDTRMVFAIEMDYMDTGTVSEACYDGPICTVGEGVIHVLDRRMGPSVDESIICYL